MVSNAALEEGFHWVKQRFLGKLKAWLPTLDGIATEMAGRCAERETLVELRD